MKTVEERFILFATAEECAKAAAPVFAEHKWRWLGVKGKRGHIPNESDIFNSLQGLEQRSLNRREGLEPYLESGRLVYYHGRFGYQRPLGLLVSNIWERTSETVKES